jgi:hypothetical protein
MGKRRLVYILERSLKAEDFGFTFINLCFRIPSHSFFLRCHTSLRSEHAIVHRKVGLVSLNSAPTLFLTRHMTFLSLFAHLKMRRLTILSLRSFLLRFLQNECWDSELSPFTTSLHFVLWYCGFELRPQSLVGRSFIAWVTPPVLLYTLQCNELISTSCSHWRYSLELLWWFPVLHGAASCLISSQCWVQLITYSTSFFFFPWHCGFLVSSYSLATFVCLLFTHSSLISTGSQHYF